MAHDSLPNRTRAAMNRGRNLDFAVARADARRVFAEFDTAERGIDEEFGAVSHFVGVMKELCGDAARFIRDVDAWIRDAIEKRISGFDAIVQDSIVAYDFRIEIRQQGKGNSLLFGELA